MPFYQSSEYDEPQPPPSPPRDPRRNEQRFPLLPGERGLQRTPPPKPRKKQQRFPLFVGERGPILTPAPKIKPPNSFRKYVKPKPIPTPTPTPKFNAQPPSHKRRAVSNLTGRYMTGNPLLDGINLAFNIGYQAEGFLARQALRIEPLQDLLGIDEIESLSPEALGGESMTVITGQESGLNLIDSLVNLINRQGEPGSNKAVSTGLPFLDVLVSGTADEDLLTHETTHVAEQRQEGLLPWLVSYSMRLAVDTAKYGSFRAAYEQNPDEIEARKAVNPKYKPPPAPPFWWRTEARRQARERLIRQMLSTSHPRGP